MTSALSGLAAALNIFRGLTRSTVGATPISLVQTFLLVAEKPDRTVSELATAANVTTAAMGRLLSDLSLTDRHGGAGLGLIDQKVYIYDRRITKSRLSVKGLALAQKIADAIERRPVKAAA